MSTKAQIRANRRNARKSTGRRTPEGKAVVSQNAVTHGLTARQDVISSESQAEFDLYRDGILGELAPASPMESMLAERIVSLSWRLKRAGRVQNQTIDAMNTDRTQETGDSGQMTEDRGRTTDDRRQRTEGGIGKTGNRGNSMQVSRITGNQDTADLFDNCRECSTNRRLFFQNKANFPAGQDQVSSVLTKDYEEKGHLAGQAKQTQTKPISAGARNEGSPSASDSLPALTKFLHERDDFANYLRVTLCIRLG